MPLVSRDTRAPITHHYFIDDAGVVHVGIRDGRMTMTKCDVYGMIDGMGTRPLTQYPRYPARVVTCIMCGYRKRFWFP